MRLRLLQFATATVDVSRLGATVPVRSDQLRSVAPLVARSRGSRCERDARVRDGLLGVALRATTERRRSPVVGLGFGQALVPSRNAL